VDDVIHRLLERDKADRSLLAGFGQAVHEFAAIERFVGAIAFDDAQVGALDLLVSGEPVRAL
jgi:hypothetical protein